MIFFICMIPKYGFLTTYQISDSDMQPIPGKATQGIPGQHRARLLFPDEPVLYLDEIQDQLLQYRNIEVSLATVSRTLCRITLTHKKISSEALERNELLRATWQAAYADIPAECCVWLDESSVDNRTNQCTSGWAEVGRACVRRELFIRGQHFSVLPAFTCDGYIAVDIFEGSMNKEKFIRFLEEQVVSFQLASAFIEVLIFVVGPKVKSIPWPPKCRNPRQLYHPPR